MSFDDWRQTKAKIAMGEKVGRIDEFKFLRETACVHVEERQDIAWMRVYQMINPEDTEFNTFLEEVAIPALKEIGRAKWYRDTITDLSLALSLRERKADTDDTTGILAVDKEGKKIE